MSVTKRLTFVGPMHPYRGGIAQFGETLFHGLSDRGHDTRAVTFSRQYPSFLFPGKTQMDAAPPARPLAPLRLIDSLNPWSWLRTARTIRDHAPHAAVFQFWLPFFGPAYGTIAKRLGQSKIIGVVHNAIPHEARPGDRVLAQYFLRRCHTCIVMSEAVEHDLRSLGVTVPIERVVHPVYDIFGDPVDKTQARAALGLDPGAKVILFFGFIRKYKGLDVLLEAMPRIGAAFPDAHLVVAGEFYDDEAPYRRWVEEHGLQNRVHFHADYIPNEKVSTYFSAADAVVQPYRSATQSGVAQIAFHFNKPSIVTAVGGLPEIIPHEKAGLIVPPQNSQALAGEVIRFYQEGLEARLVEGVRAIKGNYSWDVIYRIIENNS